MAEMAAIVRRYRHERTRLIKVNQNLLSRLKMELERHVRNKNTTRSICELSASCDSQRNITQHRCLEDTHPPPAAGSSI